jgi:hypothetical protein
LRSAEGFLRSIVRIMGLTMPVPDHTTLSRRSKALDVCIRTPGADGPMDIAVDSTGLKIYVGRQRRRFLRGAATRRPWRKLHLTVSMASGEILATALTPHTKGDAARVPEMLEQVKEPIGSFAADGAYDRRSVYAAIQQHQPAPPIRVIIPPRVDAKLSARTAEAPTQRDGHIMAIRNLGRKRWERMSGYTRRSVVEVAMYRFKTLVGRNLRGRSLETKGTEAKIGGRVLNIMRRLTLVAREAIAA